MPEKTVNIEKMQTEINAAILEVANSGASLQKIRVCESFLLEFLKFKSIYREITEGDKKNGREKGQKRKAKKIS